MARNCSICARSDRSLVDSALRSKEPLRALAQRFATSAGALCRHRAHHLTAQETPTASEPAPEQNHQSNQHDPPIVTAAYLAPSVTKAEPLPASTAQQANAPPKIPCSKCGEKSWRLSCDGRILCNYCSRLPIY